MELDQQFMQLAIHEAQKANNLVGSNPFVGAVVVSNGQVISKGYHRQYGGAHAEVQALDQVSEPLSQATLYITLEPCTHQGKTPPCIKRVIESGVGRVVIGCLDPNPLVGGKSIEDLEANGIEVKVGVLEQQCIELNADFFKYISSNRPYVTMKSALTLDGKIATSNGDSRGISDHEAWLYTQKLRNQNQAIMVGVNTVIADNPNLNCRILGYNSPTRIIVDSNLRTPMASNIVLSACEIPTIIVTTITDVAKHQPYINNQVSVVVVATENQQVDLSQMLDCLGGMGIKSILLEPGATLASSFLNHRLVDKLIMYLSPKLIGGLNIPMVGGSGVSRISDAIKLETPRVEMLGEDILVTTYLKGEI